MEPNPPLFELLTTGFGYCHAVAIDHSDLLGSLFLAGLVGSASHCVGMCGPLVLGQVVTRMEAKSAADMRESDRYFNAVLLPYHLGRMTTYIGLGAGAAALAGGVVNVTGLQWFSAALLAIAALFFLGYALQRLGATLPWLTTGGESWWSRSVGRFVKPLFQRPVGIRGYGLGLALGFLPCGLLYGAIAAAASSGGALAGAIAMAAFALGTVPALVGIGFAGHVAGTHWRTATTRLTPILLMLNAAVLTYMAWRIVA
ncbi:MAG: sulfite exporter TauE/SafE family protein [Rhodospirillales bacterium]|nr:sulfite exporter TauE/SafE family protein [Rhodospirillales bacterium]